MADIKLSEQQYELVSILWRLGGGSARDVLDHIVGQKPAYTTVATMLGRLEKRGVLASETRGRERWYTATVSESEVRRSMVGDLVSTLFKGDPGALIAHLVREGDVNEQELAELKALLDSDGEGDD